MQAVTMTGGPSPAGTPRVTVASRTGFPVVDQASGKSSVNG